MRKVIFLLILLLALPVAAQEDGHQVYITGVWARATVMGEGAEAPMGMMGAVSAVYMTIENPGESAVKLVSASTAAAATVELHETTIGDGDVMRMRPVEDGITIGAGDSAELKPGGLHIMLIELEDGLAVGEAINLELIFVTLDESGEASGDAWVLMIGAPVLEEAPEAQDFVIAGAWARPADSGGVSAAYMHLLNRGAEDDRLIGALSSVAGVAEIHETTIGDGDVMRMRPVEALDVPAGEMVELKPGGLHVMLMELTEELAADQAILVTLVFESGQEIVIAVPVHDPNAEMPAMHGHSH